MGVDRRGTFQTERTVLERPESLDLNVGVYRSLGLPGILKWGPRGSPLGPRRVREHPSWGSQTLSCQPGVEGGSEKRPKEDSGESSFTQDRFSDSSHAASCWGTSG